MEEPNAIVQSATATSAPLVDFETAMKNLEAVVSELDGEVKLEQALHLFEQGMKLSQQCEDFLKGAEQRIEMLKRGDDGSLVAVPVVGDNFETAIAVARVEIEKVEKPAPVKRKKIATADGDIIVAESEQLGLGLGLNFATT
ncbi:MAG: exodeoxyribonuclease VII small subunit [Candidatus Melainabacteria bacterium]|nr:exodeoxyribonuclease VII small subunit [Candidatus Melainabacteria bacterium]